MLLNENKKSKVIIICLCAIIVLLARSLILSLESIGELNKTVKEQTIINEILEEKVIKQDKEIKKLKK